MLSYQSWAKADDIKDFGIEGVSIGDSALDFMSFKKIKKNRREYNYNDDSYYVLFLDDLKEFDDLEIYLKKNDDEYKIYSIDAVIYFKNQLKKCLLKQKELSKVFDEVLLTNKNIYKDKLIEKNHSGDVTGISKNHIIYYFFKNSEDYISLECVNWSNDIENNNGWSDHLRASITREVIDVWLRTKAYK
tara:strand:- start:20 stop:586 length:567 start_codon:yes stop_codon:yes gene_type:complete